MNDEERLVSPDDDFFLFAGLRSVLLHKQAFAEEGLPIRDSDERVAPAVLLYPRSWVEAVNEMPGEKVHDYSFVGTLYRPETFRFRSWILDFARERFTDDSYFLLTEGAEQHTSLGSFDHTFDDDDVFVPKNVPWLDRAHFHPPFYAMLRASRFTLCPAGDAVWSMRFFEAIMCRSIPVVASVENTGRNLVERSIGYHVCMVDEPHVYDEEIAEHNYQLFLERQTLIGRA